MKERGFPIKNYWINIIMSNIIWSPKAVSQLENIFNYINKDSKIYSKIVVQ